MTNAVSYNSQVSLSASSLGGKSYTWAQLQAAFPNNSPALAALPDDAVVFVKTWNAYFVPNPTKTRWRPVGFLTLAADGVVRTNTIDDNQQKQLAQVLIPPGFLEPGGVVTLVAQHTGAANTAAKIFRVYVNNSPGVDFNVQPTPGQTLNSATQVNGTSACRFQVNSLSPFTFTGFNVWGEAVTNTGGMSALTVDNGANPESVGVYLSVQGQLAVGGVSMSLVGIHVTYQPPQSF